MHRNTFLVIKQLNLVRFFFKSKQCLNNNVISQIMMHKGHKMLSLFCFFVLLTGELGEQVFEISPGAKFVSSVCDLRLCLIHVY
jgi:hypothetical protein